MYQATAVQPTAYQPTAYQPNPYQPGQYQPGPPSGLSITSMVLGIVSLLFSLGAAGLLPGIAAVITGHLAARRQPHAKGFWLTGLIAGYVSIGIGLLVMVIPLVASVSFLLLDARAMAVIALLVAQLTFVVAILRTAVVSCIGGNSTVVTSTPIAPPSRVSPA